MKSESRNSNFEARQPPAGVSDFGFRISDFEFLIPLLLAATTLLIYLPVRNHDFVSYDDPLYVTGNRHVQAGLTWTGVKWAFTTGHAGNWHPLTWLSHMLDVTIFGTGAAGPHLVNVLLHAANTVLLFLVLRRFTRLRPGIGETSQPRAAPLWPAALVAALFALHPLHVESVAWAAERKDVLSAFFFLLTLLAYERYVSGVKWQAPGIEGTSNIEGGGKGDIQHSTFNIQRSRDGSADHRSLITDCRSPYYALCLVCFALGLMSKPMLVTLPFVLLLLDFWPLARVSGPGCQVSGGRPRITHHASRITIADWGLVIREKIPFFLLTVLSCVVTFIVQKRGGAVESLARFSIGERLGNAVVAYARYLGKTFWPADLATPYPHPGHWPAGQVVLAALLVGALCLGALWFGRRFPFALTGWFWFFGTMLPTIGLVQVGNQSMADRYTYLPLIGVFILIAWGAGEAVARWRLPRMLMGTAAGVVLVACAAQTSAQLRHWRDSESLFRHVLALTQGSALAHNNLGNALLDKGQADEAIAHFHKALRIDPGYADAHINLGTALLDQGRVDEASIELQTALRLQPHSPDGHYNLGNLLLRQGQADEAMVHYRKALDVAPDHLLARNNLANTLLHKGEVQRAIIQYHKVLEIRPDYVVAHHNLGMALLQTGQSDDAIAHFRKIVELQPGSANVRNNLGWALRQAGRLDEAAVQLRKALEIQPDYPEAHGNLAKTLVLKGEVHEGIAHFRTALRLKPDDPQNLSDLAWVLATWPEAPVRNAAEALELARKADQLSNGQDAAVLRVLAAACAESGRFDEAVSTARRALQRAGSNAAFTEALGLEVGLYESGLPVRDGPKSETRKSKSE